MTNIRSDLPRERLIFALDIGRGGIDEALAWVDRLQGHVGLFKVGKEAYTIYGPTLVERIQERGARVFLAVSTVAVRFDGCRWSADLLLSANV